MFIGQKEIDSIKGKNVFFKDGTKGVYTKEQQKYLITEEEKDDTQLRDMMLSQVVPDIMNILAKHNVKKVDINAIIQVVIGEYNDMFNKAIGKAFGTYVEGRPTEYFPEDIRFSHIQRYVK